MTIEQAKLEAEACSLTQSERIKFHSHPLWQRLDNEALEVVFSAIDYLNDHWSKKKSKFILLGPNNKHTHKLIERLAIKHKPSFLEIIIAAAEQERQKKFLPNELHLDEPKDGEWVEENPLTWEQFQAKIQA